MSERVDVIVIGFSHGHQLDYGANLAADARTRLVGVSDLPDVSPDARATGRQFAERFGSEYVDDYRQLLERVHPRAASVAVPSEANVAVVRELARRGVSVMCEKPVADTLAELDDLGGAIRESGITFTFCVPATVFSSAFAPAIEQVQAGAIGQPRAAYFQFLQPNGPQYTLTPERCAQVDRAELANFGPYGVVTLGKLVGRPIRRVFARNRAAFYEHYREHGLEDLSVLSLSFDGGAIATMVVGRTTTAGLPTTDCRAQVIGSAGTVNVEYGIGYAVHLYRDGSHRRLPFGSSTARLFVDDFIDAVLTGRRPKITFDDARQVTAVLDAAYASGRTHQPVEVA